MVSEELHADVLESPGPGLRGVCVLKGHGDRLRFVDDMRKGWRLRPCQGSLGVNKCKCQSELTFPGFDGGTGVWLRIWEAQANGSGHAGSALTHLQVAVDPIRRGLTAPTSRFARYLSRFEAGNENAPAERGV